MFTQALPYILVSFFGFVTIMFIRIESRLSRMEGNIGLLMQGKKLVNTNSK